MSEEIEISELGRRRIGKAADALERVFKGHDTLECAREALRELRCISPEVKARIDEGISSRGIDPNDFFSLGSE